MFEICHKHDLIAFFNHYTSQVRAKIVTRTPVKLNKKDVATKTMPNPFEVVYKIQTVEVDIGADYQDKVNDARLLEGDLDKSFRSGERAWGEHVNKAIVENDGQFYLNVIEVAKVGSPVYELLDGTRVDYSVFEAFVPEYKGSVKQRLQDEVKVRSFKLENVIGLNIDNKVRYIAR